MAAAALFWAMAGSTLADPVAANTAHLNGYAADQRGDYASALRWYRIAAAKGYAKSHYNIGLHYMNGHGVPKDYSEAAKWFDSAATRGSVPALYNLGVLYESGAGVARDPVRAQRLYSLAADQGDEEAVKALEELANRASSSPTLRASEARPKSEKSPGEPSKRTVQAVAQGMSMVPGAIVCPNYELFNLAFDLYGIYWQESLQDAMTSGQARLLRGTPMAPRLEKYGCALVPAGTALTLELGNVVPVVTVESPRGKVIRGVTHEAMVRR